jgi:uncharacterized membrane protein
MNPLIAEVLLSMAPVSELRGGIPWALSQGVSPYVAYIVAVLANIVVVPIIFFFLESVHHYFMNIKIYKKVFDRFMERARKKLHKKVEKYGYFGLTLFVAIPLPVTGAWTGTLGAWFFGMDKIKSFFAILLGVLIAGLIVTAVYFTGGGIIKAIFIKGF